MQTNTADINHFLVSRHRLAGYSTTLATTVCSTAPSWTTSSMTSQLGLWR